MGRLTRDGATVEPVSRDQIFAGRRERGQGNTNFPYSADHEQDWQPYPVDPYWTLLASNYCTSIINSFDNNIIMDGMLLSLCDHGFERSG